MRVEPKLISLKWWDSPLIAPASSIGLVTCLSCSDAVRIVIKNSKPWILDASDILGRQEIQAGASNRHRILLTISLLGAST